MFRWFRPVGPGLAALAVVSFLGCSQKDAGDATESAAPGNALPSSADVSLPAPSGDLRADYTSLQQRLNGLQERAMQDSVLQKSYMELEAMMEARMTAADPRLAEHRNRLGAIQQEMGAAQQAGQEEKMKALVQEGMSIQNGLRRVQEETLTQEDVKKRMDAFRESIVAKMTEFDPAAPAIIARANEIGEQLSAGAAMPPAGTVDE